MKIKIKDFVRHAYYGFRLLLHRILYKVRFIEPAQLHDAEALCVLEIQGGNLKLPTEYTHLSSSYGTNGNSTFATENVFIYTPSAGAIIHQGRFVEMSPNRLLNVGNQSNQRWRALEHPYTPGPSHAAKTVIIPWGLGGASYGDFVIQVLPKLARLLSVITSSELRQATVCLPFFYENPWALEYLRLLGIRTAQVQDGSHIILVPPNGSVIVGSGPSSQHGIACPHDIDQLLRQLAQKLPAAPSTPWRRLYISRKIGRMMVNEAALIDGLQSRGFELIHLEGFSVTDQIRLFQEAAVVVGPHGAGHANIMWSAPGTHLLEVFHPSWMHPCYAILAKIRGIHHHSLVGFSGAACGSWTRTSRFGIFEDPAINPNIFFRKIDEITHS